jgi:uncharacterized protein
MKKAFFLLFSLACSTHNSGDDRRVEEVEFVSHGAKLSGSIVFPARGAIHAAVVFIHGSGRQMRFPH